jgi:hypothetical protein
VSSSADAGLPPLGDNPNAPVIYATACTGVFLSHGNLHLTFEGVWPNHDTNPPTFRRVVAAQVVMPLPSGEGMTQMLQGFLTRLRGMSAAMSAPPPDSPAN